VEGPPDPLRHPVQRPSDRLDQQVVEDPPSVVGVVDGEIEVAWRDVQAPYLLT
jgi:hypothetical protein